MGAGKLQQARDADGLLAQQRHDGPALGVLRGDGVDLAQFVAGALAQQWRSHPGGRHAVVDDPGPGLDAGAAQIVLQIGGFEHRRGLGQRDQNHLGLLGVLELHHRRGEVHAGAAHLAHDVAVVGAGGVQQQERVASGRRIHHDKLLAGFADGAREGLEDGDFFGARRAQVFFEQCASGGIQFRALGRQHLLAVALGDLVRVDAAHGEVLQRAAQRLLQVGCRVRRGQMHRKAPVRQFHRDGGGQRGLADAALAHQHHQAVAVDGNAIHQRSQAWQVDVGLSAAIAGHRRRRRVHQQLAQGLAPHQVEGLERHKVGRQRLQGWRHGGEHGLLASANGSGQRVLRRFARRKHAVHHQVLLPQTDGPQFAVRACGFAQRGLLRAGHQHQPGARAVGQRRHGRRVLAALLFQPGQRSEAGGIALGRLQKAAPGPRQLQQTDGVAGGRCVKNDVLVARVQAGVGQQRGELVKRRNFCGAGARELLFNALDHVIGQHAAHRPDDAVAVALGSGLWVDLQRPQAWHLGHGRDLVADRQAKHLAHVRRRVGADQQHALAAGRQLHGRGAGQRGLADAAFAGEKEKTRCVVEKLHGFILVVSAAGAARTASTRRLRLHSGQRRPAAHERADAIQLGLEAGWIGFQIFQRQNKKRFDARAQRAVGGQKGGIHLCVGTGGVCRVVHTPVRAQHRPQIGGAGFAGGAGAHGDHHVGDRWQVVPRLAVAALRRDAFARQQGQRARMHLSGGLAAGAQGAPARRGQVVEAGLGKDGAARVAGTKEQDIHGRLGKQRNGDGVGAAGQIGFSIRAGWRAAAGEAFRHAQPFAQRRLAGAAFVRQIGDQFGHQGDIGPVALVASLLCSGQQTGLRERLQVERHIGGGQAQRGRNLAGHQPLRALFDEQAKDIEPNARGQGFKDGGGGGLVHIAIIQQ